MFNESTNAITFPKTINAAMIRDAVLKALADEDFMGNIKKVKAAAEALTPKDTLTATLKRLQGNANKDFLVNKDECKVGFTDTTKAAKLKEYVTTRFQSYMDDPKTSEKATKLYTAAYPAEAKAAVLEDALADD